VAIDDDGWPLDASEAASEGQVPPVPPVQPAPPPVQAPMPQMPSPAAAAYEAARIVGEMVGDIESAPGAALMAAAAAGAAIEVARARVAAGEQDRGLAAAAAASEGGSADPVITVRMQRDRILRALAEDIAATATAGSASAAGAAGAAAAAGAAGSGERAMSQIGLRADPG